MLRSKSLIAITIVIMLMIYVDILSQWEIQNSGVTVNLYDVCFVDSLTGCVVGDSATILKTNNSGNNWIKIPLSNDKVSLRKVFFLDEYTGIIAGSKGTILRTSDGGNNWENRQFDSTFFLGDIFFIDKKIGWICGGIDGLDFGGVIFKTTDGGINWTKQLETLNHSQLEPYKITGIFFMSADTGLALANLSLDPLGPAEVLKTTDGGDNWYQYSMTKNSLTLSFSQNSQDVIWTYGFGFEISFDEGQSWESQTITEIKQDSTLSSYSPSVYDVLQMNSVKGYLIVYDYIDNKIKILYTENMFAYWTAENILDNILPTAICGIDNKILWSVGRRGLIMSKRNIPTGITERPLNVREEEANIDCYPNPCNSSTSINYYLPFTTNIKIEIYNSIGEKINTIFSGFQTQGYHKFVYYNPSLASGVYYILLNHKNRIYVDKLIFLK